MKTTKFVLPEGHQWHSVDAHDSTHYDYQCKECGAVWSHDMTDDSIMEDDGDGSCNS